MKQLVLVVILTTIASTYKTGEVNARATNGINLWEILFNDKGDKGDKGDIEVIRGGKAINISDYMTTGKITILDFYADWCGPCRALSSKLVKYVKANSDVALKKLDIVNWRSPLSKQMSRNYELVSIPFVLIFDENGKLLGKVIGNDIASIKLIIAERR